jgi:hypothetical protein
VQEDDCEFTWNGRRLKVGGLTSSDLFHEVAHWLLAPPRRRKLPGYGLGSEPYAGATLMAVVSGGFASKEEGQASVLGICYERAFGEDWWDTAEEHNWMTCPTDGHLFCGCYNGVPTPDFFCQIAILNKRGLLRGWMPTVLPERTT